MKKYRYFLKDSIRKTIDFSETDQSKGIPPPPIEKPFPTDAKRTNLLSHDKWKHIENISLISAIQNRKSRRNFLPEPLTLEELS